MEKTLGEMVDASLDTSLVLMVNRVDALHRRDSGKGIRDFVVGDANKMGDAIGTYEIAANKKSLRPDALRDFETLAHTAMHETRHQIGFLEIGGTVGTLDTAGHGGVGCEGHCVVDGLIEHYLHEEYGFKPVDAYADLARAAGKLVNELGDKTYTLASQGAQSEGLLVQHLVEHRMENARTVDVVHVVENARRDVRALFAQ